MRLDCCSYCNRFNTAIGWCQSCDPQSPMSGVKELDDFLIEIQHEIDFYEGAIEWIPFDRLKNIKEIGKGGFSTVYSATWIDGARARSVDYKTGSFVAKRLSNCTVALKILDGAQDNFNNFLHEVRNFEFNIKMRI